MLAKYRTPEKFAHGTRARYAAGCRCGRCRKANRDYERTRIAARRDGDYNGLVSAAPVRRHLLKLQKAGIGRRTVERLSGVSRTIVQGVKSGKKTHIRARTAKLILAVTEVYTRAPIPGELGWCEPCWREKKHLCLATVKRRGVAKCSPCAEGRARCDYATGQGWYRGDGTKGYPPDLPAANHLARKHPHGHYMRYKGGCRCRKCKEAARAYMEKLRTNRILFGPNNLVSIDKVKAHLLRLQSMGVGHQTVAKYTGVAKTGLAEILWYGKSQMRRRSANAVLAFRPSLETFPKNKPIPAGETVKKLEQLIRWGIPRGIIDRDAFEVHGNHPALQLPSLKGKSPFVIVRTALAVRDYFAKVERMRTIWLGLGHRIPARHYVYWKPGCRGMTVRSFELRPFPRTYDYAVLYPPELKQAIRAKNILRKQYRAKRRATGHAA